MVYQVYILSLCDFANLEQSTVQHIIYRKVRKFEIGCYRILLIPQTYPGGHRKRSITTSDDKAWERRKRDGRRDRVYLWINRIVPYEIDGALGR